MNSSLHKLLCIILILIVNSLSLFANVHKNEDNLKIYFKPTECVKCYFYLSHLNELSKKVRIEIVLSKEDEQYCIDLLKKYKVKVKNYKISYISEKERSIYNRPFSEYKLSIGNTTYYGNYEILNELESEKDSIFNNKYSKGTYRASNEGAVGYLTPFIFFKDRLCLVEPKLGKLEIKDKSNLRTTSFEKYFDDDSTFKIFKIYPNMKKIYFKKDGKFDDGPNQEINFLTDNGGDVYLSGSFFSALTPLYKENKRCFIIKFCDTLISSKDYMYVKSHDSLILSLDYDFYLNLKQTIPVFYGFGWQYKDIADSFFVVKYEFNSLDTTWYLKRSYLLDVSTTGFDFTKNIQTITYEYAVHSLLPILYYIII